MSKKKEDLNEPIDYEPYITMELINNDEYNVSRPSYIIIPELVAFINLLYSEINRLEAKISDLRIH